MEKKIARQKKWTHILLVLLVFVVGYFLFEYKMAQKEREFGVERNHPLLLAFEEKFPQYEVIKCGLEDINGDKKEDLLVLYRKSKDKNEMLVVMDKGGSVIFSEPRSAPMENQEIKYLDIDKKAPMEFIVSGSKNGLFGYAIFRLEHDHEIRDLFGEGMDHCCN